MVACGFQLAWHGNYRASLTATAPEIQYSMYSYLNCGCHARLRLDTESWLSLKHGLPPQTGKSELDMTLYDTSISVTSDWSYLFFLFRICSLSHTRNGFSTSRIRIGC